jgi:hypothetical protein
MKIHDYEVWLACAEATHEANRIYCAVLGDESQVAWAHAPQWQRDSAILGIKGIVEDNATPADSHQSWLAEKERTNWKFGLVKDAELKTHPCMVPYDQLPKEQQAKDHLFGAVARAMYAALFPELAALTAKYNTKPIVPESDTFVVDIGPTTKPV